MTVRQRPVPGFYYINFTGQLIKVRALLYAEGEVRRVVLEYLDGSVIHVPMQEWDWLDLARYTDWLDRRRPRLDLEREL